VVESTALEMRRGGDLTVGSNPTLSAICCKLRCAPVVDTHVEVYVAQRVTLGVVTASGYCISATFFPIPARFYAARCDTTWHHLGLFWVTFRRFHPCRAS
jgi:hypothetical protein